jgi:hypothetical protein
MTQTYPIVEQRRLAVVQKRGVPGLRRKYREDDELLKANAHQVLVYRVNGQYVVDHARFRGDDGAVIDASHVSVVDMTRDKPIMVRLEIPSNEGRDFTVQVTFVCTVTDPVLVVREGLQDAQTTLWAYLKSHHRIFELGLDHQIRNVNEVRRDVNAQVQAFTSLKPPITSGMMINLTSVEVLTPDEVAELAKVRWSQERDHTLASERQRLDHNLARDRQRNEHHLHDTGQMHDHQSEYRQSQHTQLVEAEARRHKQLLDGEQRDFDRRELEIAMDLIEADPRKALLLAYAAGRLEPMELANELRADDERERQLRDVREERDRQDRIQLEQELRQDKLAELAQAREDGLLRVKADRHLLDRRDEWQREDQRWQQDVVREVLSGLVERGVLDNTPIKIDKIGKTISDALADSRAALDNAPPPELAEPDRDDSDVDVREEDAG